MRTWAASNSSTDHGRLRVKRERCSNMYKLTTADFYKIEPWHDKTNKMIYSPSEDSDKSVRPVWSVFAVRLKKVWIHKAQGEDRSSLGAHNRSFYWFCHAHADIIFKDTFSWHGVKINNFQHLPSSAEKHNHCVCHQITNSHKEIYY